MSDECRLPGVLLLSRRRALLRPRHGQLPAASHASHLGSRPAQLRSRRDSHRAPDPRERTVAFGPVIDPATTRTRVPAIKTRDLRPAPSAPYIRDLGMHQRHLRQARPFRFRGNRHDRKLPA